MITRKLFYVLMMVGLIFTLTFTSAGAQAGLPNNSPVDPEVVFHPNPISPKSYTYTNLPVFKFTQFETVTKYKITVTKEDGTLYYVFKGTANCFEAMCSMQPTTPVKGKYGLVSGKGVYRWTVQAKTGVGTWSPPQDPSIQFALITTGFDSSFNTDKKNWQDIKGVWELTTNGFLKNIGVLDEYTSMAHQHYIVGDFVYETRIRLKSKHAYTGTELDRQAGGIIVIGHPYEFMGKQIWHQGIYVLIRNDQKARIFEYWNDEYVESTDTAWVSVPAINPDDWNTIKVVKVGGNLLVKINDVDWMTYTDPVHGLLNYNGFVGLTHYRYNAENEKMQVDWAKYEKLNPPMGE